MRTAGDVGLAPTEPEIDFGRVMDRVHGTIATIEPHDSRERLRGQGVEVIEADSRFLDARTLEAGGRRLRLTPAILATGSEPSAPPVDGVGGDDVLTTESVWGLARAARATRGRRGPDRL